MTKIPKYECLMTLRSYSNFTEAKIAGFGKIEKGWHYGEGGPIDDKVIRNAIKINNAALSYGFTETDAFPGLYGEVQFCIYHNDHYLEFMIEADDKITYVYELRDVVVDYKEDINIEEALNEVRLFGRMLCNSSGLSTKDIMMQKKGDSLVWLLRTPAMVLESQS
ncbi:hypothetical protein [Candidatus Magnetominusculus xianensis]|uniref:Uncharacterized protein n=1 Tax=Candidatus Magnetominusculus xianensis TaxID=1748249 RepID=A0ABR5SHW9_9BACT|nr:hypothetical protein [Candidatus Magnetominusculus xianensis]KWT91821.1 hypothetical protein ASN18_0723 [Candidatus Magnetominusculus xianensis]MBF0403877.1 hypothetical protein [Nitrospirota bacterium]